MERDKYVRTIGVHRKNGTDTVSESLTETALYEFLGKDTTTVTEDVQYDTFHGIDNVRVQTTVTKEEVEDDTCQGDEPPEPPVPPVITWDGVDTSLSVDAGVASGTSYDTKTGVHAYADGVEIPFTASPSSLQLCNDEEGTITYTAMGESVERTYHVYEMSQDSPQISGVKDLTVAVNIPFDAMEGVSATGDYDTPATVVCDAPTAYSEVGEYTITYTATDKCGHTKSQTATVTVVRQLVTTLFDDGTLIINELGTDRAANIAEHGDVVKEYEPHDRADAYVFNSLDDQPWKDERALIKKVEFGSQTTPMSMAFWFQRTNIEDIDWTNLDGIENTSLRACFDTTKMKSISGFPEMPQCTDLRYMLKECQDLVSADLSGINSEVVEITRGTFQASYNLKTVILAFGASNVQDCRNMFSDNIGDGKEMKIETIYNRSVDDGGTMRDMPTFSEAGLADNMFRSCTSLMGGEGTVYDPIMIANQLACCDYAHSLGIAGYFTVYTE